MMSSYVVPQRKVWFEFKLHFYIDLKPFRTWNGATNTKDIFWGGTLYLGFLIHSAAISSGENVEYF